VSCPLVVGPSNDADIADAPLRCIAVCPDTSSDCSGRIHQAAFGAWSLAKEDILTTWTRFTDIRNLQAEIPKAMRDAVSLIDSCPPPGLDQQEVDELHDALNAPYPERILRHVRDALALETDDEKETALAELRTWLGLIAPPDPQPLPAIDADDVHLVCWMAVVPAMEEVQG
jgi:hypothetical protein